MNLNDIMDLDHVIRVHDDGVVTDDACAHAPEVCVEVDEDGQVTSDAETWMVRYVEAQGWSFMNGYSAQCGYAGPVMHPSEFIGGRLADDILATPGAYVACEVTGLYPVGTPCEETDEPIGWVILQRMER